MKVKAILFVMFVIFHGLNLHVAAARAQGTAFTYQGHLNDGAAPANGSYDFQFILFNVNQFGFPTGPILTNSNVVVNNGLFTTSLDFGPGIFVGTNYWLEIGVRPSSGGAFTTLNPRQPINSTPYAIFAETGGTGGLAAGTYSNAVMFNNASNQFTGGFNGEGVGLTGVNADRLGGLSNSSFWKLGGNPGTAGDFIGTTDAQTFDIRVNNARAMRYRLGSDAHGQFRDAPNIVGGYSNNSAPATIVGATIAGGGSFAGGGGDFPNKVTVNFGSVSGGIGNTASGFSATVGGGGFNTASGSSATVAGGNGNNASGENATVSGGSVNTASGDNSFAAGTDARAAHSGSFVWADNHLFTFSSTASNQFRVRATGGAAFVTAIDGTGGATAGVRVQSGDTSWSAISDRNAKKNFSPVNAEAVLEQLAVMPMEKWNYIWEPDNSTPHIGPMAQDFKAAFYPGRDDKSISTLEFDGVELAAIQGLHRKLQDKATEIQELKQKNDALEKRLNELQETVRSLSQKMRSP